MSRRSSPSQRAREHGRGIDKYYSQTLRSAVHIPQNTDTHACSARQDAEVHVHVLK
jgi:hypothetical protein